MNATYDLERVDVAPKASEVEKETRRDVAGAYRLLSVYGFSDLTDGFVSARLTDSPKEFVVGGYAQLPELVNASGLHKRSLDNEAKLEKRGGVDIDAFNFSKTVYSARPDLNACIHAHTESGTPFSALDCDLLPITQYGMMFAGKVAFVDFVNTEVTSGDARDTIGDKFANGAEIVILRNHGLVVPGRTVAQAFFHLYRIEQAMRWQIRAMQTGAPMIMPDAKDLEAIRNEYWTMTHIDNDGSREWPDLLRKLDRIDTSFRD